MPEAGPSNGKASNGAGSLLSTLAHSTDRWVQLGTLGLIAFTGIGNWITTWKAADSNKHEIVQGQERIRAEVIRQVQDIHTWIRTSTDEFHQGNQDAATNKRMLLKFKGDMDDFEARQNRILDNENKILDLLAKREQTR